MVRMPSDTGAAIDIQHVEQIYPNGTRALAPVRLSVAPGEFLTLLGPSGCGKSTLLKMVAGLLQPTNGRIQLAGQSLSFVFQEATLMPWAAKTLIAADMIASRFAA